MNDRQLIELVETKVPEELTVDEIEQLRAGLAESPELQQCLAQHLQMEQYLADSLGKVNVSVDRIMERAHGPAAGGLSRRAALGWGVLLVIGCSLLAGWIGRQTSPGNVPAESVAAVEPQPQDAAKSKGAEPAEKPAAKATPVALANAANKPSADSPKQTPAVAKPAKPGGDKAKGAQGATQQTAKKEKVAAANQPGKNEVAQANAPQPAPALQPVVARAEGPWDDAAHLGGAPHPLSETLYADLADDSVPLVDQLRKWLEAVPGSNFQLQPNQLNSATVHGQVKLRAPWPADAVLRLSIVQTEPVAFHFWLGREGVTFKSQAPSPSLTWAGYRTTRTTAAARPDTYALSSSDQGRAWRTGETDQGRNLNIDVRHENGVLILSRGSVTLCEVPLDGPPEEVYFDGRLWLRGLTMFRGTPDVKNIVAAEPKPADKAKVAKQKPGKQAAGKEPEQTAAGANDAAPSLALDLDRPAKEQWLKHLPTGAELKPVEDGIRLTAGANVPLAWAAVPLPRTGVAEILFELDDITPGTGVYLGNEQGEPLFGPRFFFDPQTKSVVAGYAPAADTRWQAQINFAAQNHALVSGKTWLRIVVSGGRARCWIGVDGQHWGQVEQPMPGAVVDYRTLGIYAPAVAADQMTAERGITLRRVMIREFPALSKLAPADLVARAEAPAVADPGEWLERVTESQPPEADPVAWRHACAVRGVVTGSPMAGTLTEMLLAEGMQPDRPLAERLEFLREMAEVANTWSAAELSLGWPTFAAYYDQIGTELLQQGQPPFTTLAPHFLALPLWTTDRHQFLGAPLAQSELLAAASANRRDDVFRLSGMLRWYGYTGQANALATLTTLESWAIASVDSLPPELPGGEADERPRRRRANLGPADQVVVLQARWRHPLIVELSKEGYNVLAELEVALANRSFQDVCQIIFSTKSGGAFGLLPSAKDPLLWSSFPLAVSDMMRRNPALLEMMRNRYGPLGTLRVREAMSLGDHAALEGATVQFYGTAAASTAHFWLGDRALSSGDFTGAIRHYQLAEPAAAAGQLAQIKAHRRLAGALLGRKTGEPATTRVRMGDEELTAAQFEALIADALSTRQATAPAEAARPAAQRQQVTVPLPAGLQIEPRAKLDQASGPVPGLPPAVAQLQLDWVAQSFAWEIADGVLYVNNGIQAQAYGLDGQLKWTAQIAGPDARADQFNLAPMTPVVTDGRVYLRRRARFGGGVICLAADTGKPVWESEIRQDQSVISNPIVYGDEAIVLAAEPQGRYLLVSLIAHEAATGKVRRRRPVSFFEQSWSQYGMCAVTLAGDAILATTGGSVLSIDREGDVRWARKQLWLAPELSPDWPARTAYPPLLDGPRAYVIQPGVPTIDCLEAASGRLLWSRLAPDVRRVVGIMGDKVVVEDGAGFTAFESQSGQPAWRHAVTDRLFAAVCGAPGGMLYAQRIASKKDGHFSPRLVWLAADTGRVQGTYTLQSIESNSLGFGPLLSDGARMWALVGNGVPAPARELVELVANGRAVAAPAEANELRFWTRHMGVRLAEATQAVLPGWSLLSGEHSQQTGLVEDYRGQPQVLVTRAPAKSIGRLARQIEIPPGKQTKLKLKVACHPEGAGVLDVRIGGTTLMRKQLTGKETGGNWQDLEVDLTPFTGKSVWVLVRQHDPNSPHPELYWHSADVTTQ